MLNNSSKANLGKFAKLSQLLFIPIFLLSLLGLLPVKTVLAQAPTPPLMTPQTGITCVTSRIAASSDDAQQGSVSSNVYLGNVLGSSDLQMNRLFIIRFHWGMRFQNVFIPQNAALTSADITFRANETSDNNTASMTFYHQLLINPLTFVESTSNISNRISSTPSVSWSTSQWTDENQYTTSNLSSIIQPIVNLSGWGNSNKSMVIIGLPTTDNNRRAYSYDSSTNHEHAPLLKVCYQGSALFGTISPADNEGSVLPEAGLQINVNQFKGSNGTLQFYGRQANLEPAAAFTPIGSPITLSSSSPDTAGVAWEGRTPGTKYEWHVGFTGANGTESIISPIWSFNEQPTAITLSSFRGASGSRLPVPLAIIVAGLFLFPAAILLRNRTRKEKMAGNTNME